MKLPFVKSKRFSRKLFDDDLLTAADSAHLEESQGTVAQVRSRRDRYGTEHSACIIVQQAGQVIGIQKSFSGYTESLHAVGYLRAVVDRRRHIVEIFGQEFIVAERDVRFIVLLQGIIAEKFKEVEIGLILRLAGIQQHLIYFAVFLRICCL